MNKASKRIKTHKQNRRQRQSRSSVIIGGNVIKGITLIALERIVCHIGVVGPRDEHEGPKDDERPGAVCVLLIKEARYQQAAHHQQQRPSSKEQQCIAYGLPRNAFWPRLLEEGKRWDLVYKEGRWAMVLKGE